MYQSTYRNFFDFGGQPLEKGYRFKKKRVTYTYDALNRITGATGATTSNYDVLGISYDKNGNILNLIRKGHTNVGATAFGFMDDLVYTYDNGNKLKKVVDSGNKNFGFKDGINTANDYTYDANGNMVVDNNKRITNIKYNHLNLPTRVTINGKNIDYKYDVGGMKLSKTVEGVTTQYAGGYIYKNNTLEFFNHSEGYVKQYFKTNGNKTSATPSFDYVYQYKDHLGNVRLSYTDNNKDGIVTQNEIIEESNYYPFGLKHKGYNNVVSSLGNSTAQKWGYQGQEYTENLGYNIYEYKYRHYDAAVGRFISIDPLAHTYVYNSTYAFQENKLGLGTEVEGKELELHNWLVREGVTYAAKQLDKKMTKAGLNKTEKSIATDNLLNMYKLKKSENKEKAFSISDASNLIGRHNGPRDALRHALFNALNTRTVGKELAKKLGDAHEDGSISPDIEQKMDKHNNAIGVKVAENNPNSSVLELTSKILDKMVNGEMIMIDPKTKKLTKKKLTKKGKATIMKSLEKNKKNNKNMKDEVYE